MILCKELSDGRKVTPNGTPLDLIFSSPFLVLYLTPFIEESIKCLGQLRFE